MPLWHAVCVDLIRHDLIDVLIVIAAILSFNLYSQWLTVPDRDINVLISMYISLICFFITLWCNLVKLIDIDTMKTNNIAFLEIIIFQTECSALLKNVIIWHVFTIFIWMLANHLYCLCTQSNSLPEINLIDPN